MKKTNIIYASLLFCFVLSNTTVFAQSKSNKEKEDKTEKKDVTSDNKVTKKTPHKKDTILGNKVFIVEMINMDPKKGKKNKSEDVIDFKSNKVKSKFFYDEGFPPAEYTITLDSTNVEEKEYIFTAESINEDGGLILKWEGTWDGEELTGNINFFKKDKPKGSFEFKGFEKTKNKK